MDPESQWQCHEVQWSQGAPLPAAVLKLLTQSARLAPSCHSAILTDDPNDHWNKGRENADDSCLYFSPIDLKVKTTSVLFLAYWPGLVTWTCPTAREPGNVIFPCVQGEGNKTEFRECLLLSLQHDMKPRQFAVKHNSLREPKIITT